MGSQLNIRHFEPCDLREVISLWNESLDAGDIPYKPMSQERFDEQFLRQDAYDPALSLVAVDQGKCTGFISGAVKKDFLPKENHQNTPGYISVILVKEEARGRGTGRALVLALEDIFREMGKSSVMISEASPIPMAWLIPQTSGHDHNKAPGVDIQSPGFPFLKRMGYEEGPREVAMYMDLKEYRPLPELGQIRQTLSGQGIYTGRWDTGQTFDFDRMCDRVGSEYWRRVIREELGKPVARPMHVAVADDFVVGFTGPVDRETSGRGWFSGICTDPEFERRGIATVLFNLLMQEFIAIGADFSTLFTGDTNHARRIYLRTGFRAVKSFAVMRKKLL